LDKAFEGLKSLHRDDALDAEWAEMWQRIQAIHPGDECEFQAIQAILVAHDPTTNSASTSSTEYEAWQIVAHCLLKWRNHDVARRELEDMSAGRKWFAMLDRILAAQENVHSEAFTQIRIDLTKMKPGTFHDDDEDDEDNESNNEGHALHDDNEALDVLDIVDSYVDDELDQEQKDLLNYFNLTLRQTEIWDKYGVYHVRCFVGRETSIIERITNDVAAGRAPKSLRGAFPSWRDGGLYVRATSLSPRNHPLAAYFALIEGFIYPLKQSFAYYRDTTKDGLRAEEKLLAKGKHAVPVISQSSKLIMPIHKRIVAWNRDLTYKQSIQSLLCSGMNLGSASRIGASKRKRASRPPKVLIGRTPITLFAERNNTPLSISSCFYCDEPKSCEHPGKAYKLAGQTIVNGLAICLVNGGFSLILWQDLCRAGCHFRALGCSAATTRVFVSPHFAIPGDLNPEVASELQLKKPSEGVIEEIHATDCIVNFLTKDSVEDEVRVLHGSRTFIELGITPNLVDDRISLIDKQGFVVHVHNDVDRVDIKFLEYPNLIAFHPNSLRNITLSPRISLPERPEDIGSVFRWLDPRGTTPEQALNRQATDASTGRQPWIGWSVKIIGNLELKDGIAGQEHKGATGRIVSVGHDDLMLSGLAVGVRLDLRNVPDIRVNYDRIRQSGSGCFLHDNGPKKPPIAFHSYYNFKPLYNPKYSMAELCKLLVDGKRLPELPPEMAELLRKHMVEQEEHNRQKEAAEAQETRCRRRMRRRNREGELKRKNSSSSGSGRRMKPIAPQPARSVRSPVYGYEENREVKIMAGPNGENLLEYVVKAKGPGGKLPSLMCGSGMPGKPGFRVGWLCRVGSGPALQTRDPAIYPDPPGVKNLAITMYGNNSGTWFSTFKYMIFMLSMNVQHVEVHECIACFLNLLDPEYMGFLAHLEFAGHAMNPKYMGL
ncbi:hypothetical protein BT96DRAFT_948514, partial [Gymnopus androsaceus JB14]